jgi:hypothetical protein
MDPLRPRIHGPFGNYRGPFRVKFGLQAPNEFTCLTSAVSVPGDLYFSEDRVYFSFANALVGSTAQAPAQYGTCDLIDPYAYFYRFSNPAYDEPFGFLACPGIGGSCDITCMYARTIGPGTVGFNGTTLIEITHDFSNTLCDDTYRPDPVCYVVPNQGIYLSFSAILACTDCPSCQNNQLDWFESERDCGGTCPRKCTHNSPSLLPLISKGFLFRAPSQTPVAGSTGNAALTYGSSVSLQGDQWIVGSQRQINVSHSLSLNDRSMSLLFDIAFNLDLFSYYDYYSFFDFNNNDDGNGLYLDNSTYSISKQFGAVLYDGNSLVTPKQMHLCHNCFNRIVVVWDTADYQMRFYVNGTLLIEWYQASNEVGNLLTVFGDDTGYGGRLGGKLKAFMVSTDPWNDATVKELGLPGEPIILSDVVAPTPRPSPVPTPMPTPGSNTATVAISNAVAHSAAVTVADAAAHTVANAVANTTDDAWTNTVSHTGSDAFANTRAVSCAVACTDAYSIADANTDANADTALWHAGDWADRIANARTIDNDNNNKHDDHNHFCVAHNTHFVNDNSA